MVSSTGLGPSISVLEEDNLEQMSISAEADACYGQYIEFSLQLGTQAESVCQKGFRYILRITSNDIRSITRYNTSKLQAGG